MRRASIALLAMLAVACGERQPSGLLEPIRVVDGAFRPGAFPAENAEGPRITGAEVPGTVLTVAQLGRTISGRASEETFAVGLRFADLGTGWWVTPIQGFDPSFPGERTFALELDVGGGVPVGLHTLRLIAVDEAGQSGVPFDLEVCVIDDAAPDGLNACDVTAEPPHTVVSLTWDSDVDLDLVVVTPDGKRVDARHPTTAQRIDGMPISREALADPTVGRLTRDSNAQCDIDGRNAETLVWQEPPTDGAYLLYADLFDGCDHESARFVLTVYRREELGEGRYRQVETSRRTGVVLRLAGRGGAIQPLYVSTLSFD